MHQKEQKIKELQTCPYCNKQFKSVNAAHLKKHGITWNEYLEQHYPKKYKETHRENIINDFINEYYRPDKTRFAIHIAKNKWKEVKTGNKQDIVALIEFYDASTRTNKKQLITELRKMRTFPLCKTDIAKHLKGDKAIAIYATEDISSCFLVFNFKKRDPKAVSKLNKTLNKFGIKDAQILNSKAPDESYQTAIFFNNLVHMRTLEKFFNTILKEGNLKNVEPFGVSYFGKIKLPDFASITNKKIEDLEKIDCKLIYQIVKNHHVEAPDLDVKKIENITTKSNIYFSKEDILEILSIENNALRKTYFFIILHFKKYGNFNTKEFSMGYTKLREVLKVDGGVISARLDRLTELGKIEYVRKGEFDEPFIEGDKSVLHYKPNIYRINYDIQDIEEGYTLDCHSEADKENVEYLDFETMCELVLSKKERGIATKKERKSLVNKAQYAEQLKKSNQLTKKEQKEINFKKVVILLKNGLSQREIAKKLGLTKSTINRYVKQIKENQ